MSAALDLLVDLHGGGVRLRAAPGGRLEYEGPEDLVTDEVVTELRKHKTDLLKLLRWDAETAYVLIQDALAYLAERYTEGSDLSALEPWESAINDAYAREDLGSLRAAVRGLVYSGLASFAGGGDA